MQTDDTSGSTHLEFDGMMAELLVHIDSNLYRKYTNTDEKGCKIVYEEYMKALYGTLDAVLPFLVKLSTDLER